MNWYKKAKKEESIYDIFDMPRRKITEKMPPKTEPITLTLYRGFNYLPDDYILSPEKAEQSLLWFTHRYINVYNAKDYAASHGKYLLTYPLDCIRHYQVLKWDDGSTSTTIPEEISQLEEPTENCKYGMGIELPDGWFFSYKMEKFIVCDHAIKVSPNMIQLSKKLIDEEGNLI